MGFLVYTLLDSLIDSFAPLISGVEDEIEELFEAGGFAVVITDWEIPEMDGVELVRRIRAASASGPGYVYTMLLTAKSQKEDLVEGMEAGADDFLTRPFDRDELRVRLRAGERIMQLEQELRRTKAVLAQAEKLAGVASPQDRPDHDAGTGDAE